MGEFDYKVRRQRQLLAAEELKNTVVHIHAHSLNSMWYDDRPEDTEGGKSVIDIQYMDGRIVRHVKGKKITMVKGRVGDDLIYHVERLLHDRGESLEDQSI
jgi:hypothetical protein